MISVTLGGDLYVVELVVITGVVQGMTITKSGYVEICLVHVGGTRCVPSSTDHTLKRQAWVTLTVEVIHVFFFMFI